MEFSFLCVGFKFDVQGILYLLTILLVPPKPTHPLAMVAWMAVPPEIRLPTEKAAVAADKPIPVKL